MDISLDTGNSDLALGIWSDGTTIWVTDTGATTGGLYAYTLADGARNMTKEFDLTGTQQQKCGRRHLV